MVPAFHSWIHFGLNPEFGVKFGFNLYFNKRFICNCVECGVNLVVLYVQTVFHIGLIFHFLRVANMNRVIKLYCRRAMSVSERFCQFVLDLMRC